MPLLRNDAAREHVSQPELSPLLVALLVFALSFSATFIDAALWRTEAFIVFVYGHQQARYRCPFIEPHNSGSFPRREKVPFVPDTFFYPGIADRDYSDHDRRRTAEAITKSDRLMELGVMVICLRLSGGPSRRSTTTHTSFRRS